jgi:hypothetical protein
MRQAERHGTPTPGQRGQLDATERTPRSLIERMDPAGVSGEPLAFRGAPHAALYTTELPPADARLQLDSAHRLPLAWGPHLPNLFGPAAGQQAPVRLGAAERLDIDYWRPGTAETAGSGCSSGPTVA